MRKALILFVGIVGLTSAVSANPVKAVQQPEWTAQLRGAAGALFGPASLGSNNALIGGGLGVDYAFDKMATVGIDYDYYSFNGSKLSANSNVVGANLRAYLYDLSNSRVYLGAGGGLGLNSNVAVSRFSAKIEAGMRWLLAERVGLDTAVFYRGFTPLSAMRSAVGLQLALVVPLDKPFSINGASPKPMDAVRLETPVPTPGPTPRPAAVPQAKPATVPQAQPAPQPQPKPTVDPYKGESLTN